MRWNTVTTNQIPSTSTTPQGRFANRPYKTTVIETDVEEANGDRSPRATPGGHSGSNASRGGRCHRVLAKRKSGPCGPLFPCHLLPKIWNARLFENLKPAIPDDQHSRFVYRIPIGVKRELAQNRVQISDLRHRISNRDRLRQLGILKIARARIGNIGGNLKLASLSKFLSCGQCEICRYL